MFNSTGITRELIQDGQHLANQVIANIEQQIAQRNLKYTSVATLIDELEVFIENLKQKTDY